MIPPAKIKHRSTGLALSVLYFSTVGMGLAVGYKVETYTRQEAERQFCLLDGQALKFNDFLGDAG